MNERRMKSFSSLSLPFRGTGGKNCKPVSRILFGLSGIAIAGNLYLPTHQLGRAALKRWRIWHFSTQGLPRSIVANKPRGLLPHVFTLASRRGVTGGYFLWHCLFPARGGDPPVRWCVALCCPDFPWRQGRHDSAACSAAKVAQWSEGRR
jgi:hypothetical protein